MPDDKLIAELQHEYDRRLQKCRPHAHAYRFLTERQDDGSPHVEIVGDEFHVVTTERGLELERRIFRTPDDLLYNLVALVTFWLGVDFEFKNRIEKRDVRRLIFAKQLELLKLAEPRWAERRQNEIDEILRENPFEDFRF